MSFLGLNFKYKYHWKLKPWKGLILVFIILKCEDIMPIIIRAIILFVSFFHYYNILANLFYELLYMYNLNESEDLCGYSKFTTCKKMSEWIQKACRQFNKRVILNNTITPHKSWLLTRGIDDNVCCIFYSIPCKCIKRYKWEKLVKVKFKKYKKSPV